MIWSDPPLPPLRSRITLLMDELTLASRWNSSCILLAVYRSEITRRKVFTSLQRSIRQAGGTTRQLVITPADHDVALSLRDHPEWNEAVIFIQGLQWGGGRGGVNAYHAINMHREYLVDGHTRSVFWVTQKEIHQLPRHAPDFWAFRHKVVDFPDLPTRRSAAPSDVPAALGRIQEKIQREPGSAKAHHELAALLQEIGCHEEAIFHGKKAIRFAPGNETYRLHLASLYRSMGQETLARRTLAGIRTRSNTD